MTRCFQPAGSVSRSWKHSQKNWTYPDLPFVLYSCKYHSCSLDFAAEPFLYVQQLIISEGLSAVVPGMVERRRRSGLSRCHSSQNRAQMGKSGTASLLKHPANQGSHVDSRTADLTTRARGQTCALAARKSFQARDSGSFQLELPPCSNTCVILSLTLALRSRLY